MDNNSNTHVAWDFVGLMEPSHEGFLKKYLLLWQKFCLTHVVLYMYGRPTYLCARHCFDAVFNQPWAGRSAKELSHSKLLCGNLGFQVTQLLHAGASAHRKGIRDRLKKLKPDIPKGIGLTKIGNPNQSSNNIVNWSNKGHSEVGFLQRAQFEDALCWGAADGGLGGVTGLSTTLPATNLTVFPPSATLWSNHALNAL